MFAFITISNGVAVVQHAPTGHVYRFRSLHQGAWDALTLDRVDAADGQGEPGDHAFAAMTFAKDAVAFAHQAAADVETAAQVEQGRPSLLRHFRWLA
jgi:hypothetical protein